MKHALPMLFALACAVSALQAIAATQGSTTAPSATAPPSDQHETKSLGIRTGDWEYATPQMIPLTPQPVRSWGEATQPGPRNQHVSPPHGSLVTGGARTNVPGRM